MRVECYGSRRAGTLSRAGTLERARSSASCSPSPRGFCAGVEMAIKALSWMVRGRSSRPCTATTRSCTTGSWSTGSASQGVVFVDDVDEVPAGAPLMLSAHGSAPEVVAAARDQDRFVVNAVCPLVTKVHHEAKVRARQGLHDPLRRPRGPRRGHRHARGGARRDPPGRARGRPRRGAAHRRRPVEGRAARADDAVAARLGGRHDRCPRALPRAVDRDPRRPLLRHHQPPGRAARASRRAPTPSW